MLGGLRCVLLVLSLLGYVAQAVAFRDYYALEHGDGWAQLGPGIAIIVFSPLQLSTAISVVLVYVRGFSTHTENVAVAASDGAYGLDQMPNKLARAERAAQAAMWMVGVPALALTCCVLGELLQLHAPWLSLVADVGAVLWVPIWAGGVVAAIAAMNGLGDSSWLFLSACYPVMSLIYARL